MQQEAPADASSTINTTKPASLPTSTHPPIPIILQDIKETQNYQFDTMSSRAPKSLMNVAEEPWEGKFDPTSDEFDFEAFMLKYKAEALRVMGDFPRMGLSWNQFSVVGQAVESSGGIQTVLSALDCLDISGSIGRMTNPAKVEGARILQNLTGFLEGGEMLLVLGKPGSGCSTFCKSVVGQTDAFAKVDGSMLVNGIDRREFTHLFPNESSYSGEEEFLYPTLTVRQTLDFMARCRMPPMNEEYRHGPADTTEASRTRLVNLLIKVLGLTKCADTRVGNEFLRGVSGGERKRVAIAEQVLASSTLVVVDGSTKGLDSASAFEFAHALRVACDLAGTTTVATLYQVSEAIYNEFDKVMVLFEGKCIYYGSRDAARAYMQRLGFECPQRQTTADFLTGVTTETEWQQYAVQRNGQWPPKTAHEFEAAWMASPEFAQLLTGYQVFEAQSPHRRQVFESSRKNWIQATGGTAKPSPNWYPTSLGTQLGALLTREVQILQGDWMRPVTELAFNVIMALIVGLVYLRLPLTGAGAFNRAGAIFFAALFLCFSIAATIEPMFRTRSIFYRHKSYHTYRPALYYVAGLCVEVPYRFVMVLAFSIIFYMMVGLNPEESYAHFGLFLVLMYLLIMSFGALIRVFTVFSDTLVQATQLFGMCVMLFIVYCGYLIPPKSAKPWLGWIVWINPIAYGVKGLFVNEYTGLRFFCAPDEMVPNYATAPPGTQTCSIPGSAPGTNYSDGLDWLTASYGDMGSVGENIGALIGFWVLFLVLGLLGTELVQFGAGGASVPSFSHSSETHTETDTKVEVAQVTTMQSRPALSWQNLTYTVPIKGGERRLLDNLNGVAKAGRCIALMGSSGAGKSTLLDVLAQRKTIGKVEGSIFFGDKLQDGMFRNFSGYAEQSDVHQPTATVREALRFSAYLRQPASVSKAEKDAYVEEIIDLLGLRPVDDAMIGKPDAGLSVEQRKRLTIAVELVAKPDVLFLDEPTSGLDGNTSFTIIQLVRRLADSTGISVICTIHQPSSMLFETFDDLLLLARGGRLVYFGPIGANSSTLIEYFVRNGAPPPTDPLVNPAEYILDAINARLNDMGQDDWVEAWKRSAESTMIDPQVSQTRQAAPAPSAVIGAGWWERTRLVVNRMFLNYWRLPDYNAGRMILSVFLGLLFGLSFLMVPNTLAGMQSRLFALFMTASIASTFTESVQPTFFDERNVFYREHGSGFYNWASFALAIALAEIPWSVLCSTLYFVLFYFLVGLNPAPDRIAFFWLTNLVYTLWSFSLGQSIAALSPSQSIAALVNPFVSSLLSLFAGVTILLASIPVWLQWIYWINPQRYLLGALLPNDIAGVAVVCANDEYTIFNPPRGQTCVEWAGEFVGAASGYLGNPAATSDCEYCPLQTGDELLQVLEWPYSQKWLCFGVLVLFWIINIFTTLFFIYWRRKGANR